MRRITRVFFLLFFLLFGCEEPTGILLKIDTDILVPDSMNTLMIYGRASNDVGEVCGDSSVLISINSSGEFPIEVFLEKGSEFDVDVLVTVQGYHDGEQTTEDSVRFSTWPQEEIRSIDIFLDERCLIDSLGHRCQDDQHCIEGSCQAMTGIPSLYFEPSSEVPCWSDN